MSPAEEARDLLRQLGVTASGSLESRTPIDGSAIGSVAEANDVTGACGNAQEAFLAWRTVPAPGAASLSGCLGKSFEPPRNRSRDL